MSIEYRSFHNTDPPHILRLWHECELGRGAALGFPSDAFDLYVFAEPYFDKQGLIVAFSGAEMIGFVHAGFGSNPEGSALSREAGVICAVMVRPDFRRRGVGAELVARAENYLRTAGAQELYAGESAPRDPFYLGLYGGGKSVGFLESDVNAAPFLARLGYAPSQRYILFRRNIALKSEAFDPRLVTIRRKVQLAITDQPPNATWWWMTRQGRLDSLCFALVPQAGGAPLATVTCWGMDLHSITWRERTVGLLDFFVVEKERRKGYAKTLLLDVMRRLREEMVTHVEVAAPESNAAAIGLFRSTGFEQVDRGVVYRKA